MNEKREEVEELGYSELPPEGTRGRDSTPRGDRSGAERPVYAVNEKADETGSSNSKGGGAPSGGNSLAIFFVTGIILLALGITYLYQTGGLNIAWKPVEDKPAIQQPVTMLEKHALEIELLRTIGMLNGMEEQLTNDPQTLAKVKQLRADAENIITSIK